MIEYALDVAKIEELQMLNDTAELEKIFQKAYSTVIQGGRVTLMRQSAEGSAFTFDEITTEDRLKMYKKEVFKYLRR